MPPIPHDSDDDPSEDIFAPIDDVNIDDTNDVEIMTLNALQYYIFESTDISNLGCDGVQMQETVLNIFSAKKLTLARSLFNCFMWFEVLKILWSCTHSMYVYHNNTLLSSPDPDYLFKTVTTKVFL